MKCLNLILSFVAVVFFFESINAANSDIRYDEHVKVPMGADLTRWIINSDKTYEISTYFDLGGTTLTLPENVTLLFNGGKIYNGKIILNNTGLLGVVSLKDAFEEIEFTGTRRQVYSASGFSGWKEYLWKPGTFYYDDISDQPVLYNTYGRKDFQKYSNVTLSDYARRTIIERCEAYVDKANMFTYGGSYTAFDDNTHTINGKYEINCSTFSALVSLGIPIELSKYFKDRNHFDGNGYGSQELYDFMTTEHVSSRDMAVLLHDMGFTFKPNEDFSNIDTGDILFFNLDETNDREGIDFLGIDHSGIFGYKFGDRFYTYEVCTSAPEKILRAEGSLRKVVLVARLPHKDTREPELNNMLYNSNVPVHYSGRIPSKGLPICTCHTIEPISKGKLYTCIIEAELSEDECYLYACSENGVYLFNMTNVRTYRPKDNVYLIPFVSSTDASSVIIGLRSRNNQKNAIADFRRAVVVRGITENRELDAYEYPRCINVEPSGNFMVEIKQYLIKNDLMALSGRLKGTFKANNIYKVALLTHDGNHKVNFSSAFGLDVNHNCHDIYVTTAADSKSYLYFKPSCDIVSSSVDFYINILL